MSTTNNNRLAQSLRFSFTLVALIWVIHLLQVLLGIELGMLGVYPREVFGLRGVVFSPLLHADWAHLMSNTPPLFVLTTMIFFFYRRIALPSFFMIYVLSGLAVWGFGRSVFHIGASGVVYGLVAFVFWSGIFRRSLKSIALALIVVFYYGSMIIGIFPGQEGISWESHLLGAVIGAFVAYWYKSEIEKDEKKPTYSWENEQQLPGQSFFEQDTFEKTRAERERERWWR